MDVPAWAVMLIWFGMQLLGGLEAMFSPAGVDYAAHVGGFAAGYLAVRGLRLAGFWPDEPDPREQERRMARPAAMVRDYVVARRRLQAGEVLHPADVRWVERGYESLEEDVIPATRMGEVAGQRLRVDRYPLEPIAWSDLEDPAGEQLPLAPGGRAAHAGE
jgi:Flp pilus assembly protein CpaB